MKNYIEKIQELPYVLGVDIKEGDIYVNIKDWAEPLQATWLIIQHIYDNNFTKQINNVICSISQTI